MGNTCNMEKPNASKEFLSLLIELAKKSEEMEQIAQAKLNQICLPALTQLLGEGKNSPEYPLLDYFLDVTDQAKYIKNNINKTIELLNRVEF